MRVACSYAEPPTAEPLAIPCARRFPRYRSRPAAARQQLIEDHPPVSRAATFRGSPLLRAQRGHRPQRGIMPLDQSGRTLNQLSIGGS